MKPNRTITYFLGLWCTLCVVQLSAQINCISNIAWKNQVAIGTIYNIKIDSIAVEGIFVGKYNSSKPTIVFIPGSEPVPIYAKQDANYYPMFPWQLLTDTNYNYTLLSKPGIPAIVDAAQLTDEYYYLDSVTHEPTSTYMNNNNPVVSG
jgi:hypothetical protein